MKEIDYICASQYYSDRYKVIAQYPFIAEQQLRLQDHQDKKDQTCRFCGRRRPEVSFKKEAHAVPEFLGNRAIISLNECSECNHFFGREYEDHLSKWSLPLRAVTSLKGKKYPKFKTNPETMRIESEATGIHIHYLDPRVTDQDLQQDGAFDYSLQVDPVSQPYIPLRAALALVKIACTVCPPDNSSEYAPAIDWLMNRQQLTLSCFPVLYSFTPGHISDSASEVILLQRKVDEPIPYLWCIIQFRNFRLQTFVPFCPSDQSWLQMGQATSLTMKHFPPRFGPDWPYGETKVGWSDWSSTEARQSSAQITFHVDRAEPLDSEEGK